jgi:PAS domain-containing protein
MAISEWLGKVPVSVTVCDGDGRILEMNEAACRVFEASGGAALIGTNVLDCHPEPARAKLEAMLRSGRRNCYTIRTKSGEKKMILQVPWFGADGERAGLVEFAFSIPEDLPHFDRD